MINCFRQIHRIWFIFWILVFYVPLYPFYYVFSRKVKYYYLLNKVRKLHSNISCFLGGIILKFNFEQRLQKHQTYIYCANHTSIIDLMIFCVLGKGNYHFMGKIELLKNPFFKIFFETIDIAVDRDSKISAFKSFKRAGKNLEKGMSLIIFPEGGIKDFYPPKLNEFKNGPFRLAIEHQIPLVAISITNAWQLFFDDGIKYGSKPGICDIYIHKPIETSNLSVDDADKLKEEVYKLIDSRL